MISILHYMSAKRRLKEANKTVYMMGGEVECPPMLLAQRDIIQLEAEYYAEESIFWAMPIMIIFIIVCLYFSFSYLKGL